MFLVLLCNQHNMIIKIWYAYVCNQISYCHRFVLHYGTARGKVSVLMSDDTVQYIEY